MHILGQFNLGFIIARLGKDLFIIDQHASGEGVGRGLDLYCLALALRRGLDCMCSSTPAACATIGAGACLGGCSIIAHSYPLL